MNVLGRLWCYVWHWPSYGILYCDHCYTRLGVAPPGKQALKVIELPTAPAFDWLRDYGPLWEPGTTAFWLDPETMDERNAWEYKYRVEPVLKAQRAQPHVSNPYANVYNQLAALQQSQLYQHNQIQQQGLQTGLLGLGNLLGSKFL